MIRAKVVGHLGGYIYMVRPEDLNLTWRNDIDQIVKASGRQ